MIREILAFLERTKMPKTKFGRLVANDPRLVDDIRNGREPRPATRERIAAFLRENSQ